MSELFKGVGLKLFHGREELIEDQKSDTDVIELYNKALSAEEADKVPVCYFVIYDTRLVRKYRPHGVPASDEWKVCKNCCTLKVQVRDSKVGTQFTHEWQSWCKYSS